MNSICVLMFLMNLAEPDWFTVPCEEKLMDAIICQYENYGNPAEKTKNSVSPKLLENPISECAPPSLLIGSVCIVFIRDRNITISGKTVTDVTNIHISDVSIWEPSLFSNKTFLHILKYYFSLWGYYRMFSLKFKILNILKKSSYCILFTPKRTSMFQSQDWEKQYESSTVKGTNVYLLGHTKKYQHHTNLNYFLCNDGTYIQAIYVCDNNKDCFHGSDEINCFCTSFKFDDFKNYSMTCKYIFSNHTKQYECSVLFLSVINRTGAFL